MRDVAILGQGLHPWGKFNDKPVTELCRTATEAALADAGIKWRDVEAVAAASSRFSGGKGWGLNGNDLVEDMGSTGIPVYNMSAGCSAGANAFNVGHMMVASGQHDIVVVMGAKRCPRVSCKPRGSKIQPTRNICASAAWVCPAQGFGRFFVASAWRSTERLKKIWLGLQ
jgi:acetyl-CoA acetyltransferase